MWAWWAFIEQHYLRARRAYREALAEAKREVEHIRDVEQHEQTHVQALADAEKRGATEAEIDEIGSESFGIGQDMMNTLEAIQTRQLLSRARRHGIPVPPRADSTAWLAQEPFGYELREDVAFELRQRVQAAERERAETLGKLVLPVTSILGLVVALAATIGSCLRSR